MSDEELNFEVTGPDPVPSKVESSPTPPSDSDSGEGEPVIVHVRKAGYVPPGFDLQTRIDDSLFTARADVAAIEAADTDPEVISVSRGRQLGSS